MSEKHLRGGGALITFCILAPEGVWHFPKRRFCFFLLLLLSLVLVVCNCGHLRREQRRRAKLGRRKVGEKSNRNNGIQSVLQVSSHHFFVIFYCFQFRFWQRGRLFAHHAVVSGGGPAQSTFPQISQRL